MPVNDIRSDLKQTLTQLAAITTNTTTAGSILDTAKFEKGLMLSVMASAYTDGTYNFTIEEGDNAALSDTSAVTSAQIIGTLAGLTLTAATAEEGELNTIGLFSVKRYIRISCVSTSASTGATIFVIATEKCEEKPV
jgi:hypothetical protein